MSSSALVTNPSWTQNDLADFLIDKIGHTNFSTDIILIVNMRLKTEDMY